MFGNDPVSTAEALEILRLLGAPPRLMRHGELVSQVAAQISEAFSRLRMDHNAILVATGAALHDAGKIVHPNELEASGSNHEAAGEQLLLSRGLSAKLARICRTHGQWEGADVTFEERFVALADHVWKGTRNESLEKLIMQDAGHRLGLEPWEVFMEIDSQLEKIAAGASARLASARTAGNSNNVDQSSMPSTIPMIRRTNCGCTG